MGSFHCIPSDCARVMVREYLPPVVRWRYEGEDWQEIEADDYSIDNQIGRCPAEYHVFGTYISKRKADCNQLGYWRSSMRLNGADVSSYIPVEYGNRKTGIPLKNGGYANIYPLSKADYDNRKLSGQSSLFTTYASAGLPCGSRFSQLGLGYGFELTEVIRIDGLPDDCGECLFTVTKNDNVIFEETRNECPEVEKLPCRLSDVSQEIKIEKTPWLERIEVVPYAYQNLGLGVFQADIPDECLNIYKNLTTTVIPLSTAFPTPKNSDQSLYGFIQQICSVPGCPSPEYQVICDCNEECPEGTCAIECGDRICCYGSDGIAVKSIPLGGS